MRHLVLIILAFTSALALKKRSQFTRYRSWNSRMYPVWQDGDPRFRNCWSGGEVTFDLKNDAPTLTGAKATFSINLNFPPNQTVLPDGQVVWSRNCTVDGREYQEGQAVYPQQGSEWTGVFPDGTPIPGTQNRKNRYVFVWKTWGRYWQVADGPSSSLTIGTDNIPLGSYSMEVVIYHCRGRDKFIPLGYASSIFSITDQVPFSISLAQVNDVNQNDQNFIQNQAIAFTATLHDPSQYLSSADISFTWDFGDNSGTLISREHTVTHTYLSVGNFKPQVILMASIPNGCENPTAAAPVDPSAAPAVVVMDSTPAAVPAATAEGAEGAIALDVPSSDATPVAASAQPADAAADAADEQAVAGADAEVAVPAAEAEAAAVEETDAAASDVTTVDAAEADVTAADAEAVEVAAEETAAADVTTVEVAADGTEAAEAVDATTAEEVAADGTEATEAVDATVAGEVAAAEVAAEETDDVAAAVATVAPVVVAAAAEEAAEDETAVVADAVATVAPVEEAVVEEADAAAAAAAIQEVVQAQTPAPAENVIALATTEATAVEVVEAADAEGEVVETVNAVAATAEAPDAEVQAEVEANAAQVALVLVKRQVAELTADCTVYRYGSLATSVDVVQGIESVEIVQMSSVMALATNIDQNAVDVTISCQGSLPSEVCTIISDADCITPVQTICNAATPSPDCQLILRQFFNDTGVFCLNVSLTNDVSLAMTSARVNVALASGGSPAGTAATVLGVMVFACAVCSIGLMYRRFKQYQPLREDQDGASGGSFGVTSVPLLLWNLLSRQSPGESRPLLQGRIV